MVVPRHALNVKSGPQGCEVISQHGMHVDMTA